MTDLFFPFDLPAAGTGRPEPDLLLAGRPDPGIGAVRCAWSNIRARPRTRKLISAPAIGLGVLFTMAGVFAGIFAAGAIDTEIAALRMVVMIATMLGTGALGFWLGYLLAGWEEPRATWFVGERGVQHNAVAGRRVEATTYAYADYWLLYEQARHLTSHAGGPVVDHGVFTRLDLVPKRGGAPTVFIPPAVSTEVREHVTRLRSAEAARSGVAEFALFHVPETRGPSFRAEPRGLVRLERAGFELTLGTRTERVAASALRARLIKGTIELAWPADRAQIPLHEIADSPLFLELLADRGVLTADGV